MTEMLNELGLPSFHTSSINSIICFYFIFIFLGLFVMGRHKCEVIACLSSQTQYELVNSYIVY